MALKIIVTVKQVPDTHNVTGDAMKPDGTVNRAALPAIFNPEDLNALEEAISLKERVGGTITAITMGPPNAAKVLKECLYRGADDCVLISDRKFAGADTLATSYALKCAVEKIGDYDVIFSGRQAIDGDTAQVGPQLAEKLGINQLSNITDVLEVDNKTISVSRSTEYGYEKVKSSFPVLLTVTSEANGPRTASAKRIMTYKNIATDSSDSGYSESYLAASDGEQTITAIKEWNVEIIKADPVQCGLSGSPTKVKKVQNIILTTGEMKEIDPTVEGVTNLMNELMEEHIIG